MNADQSEVLNARVGREATAPWYLLSRTRTRSRSNRTSTQVWESPECEDLNQPVLVET